MKTIVTLSGGLDSAVLLYYLLGHGDEVKALTVDYGQRHRREINYAIMQAERVGVKHEVVDLSGIKKLISRSSQTGDIEVPEGHFEDEIMKATVVPNRNMIMLSVAIGWAINEGFPAVAYAAHKGDHAIYPDCREPFAKALGDAVRLCDYEPRYLRRPFVEITKAEIVGLGHDLCVDFSQTYSCYKGRLLHCGKCGTCVERREAFDEAGITDPTTYEA